MENGPRKMKTDLFAWNDDNALDDASKVILSGGIIVYPTDTVYGFGVDATNENSIRRLNNLKNRTGPISVIASDGDVTISPSGDPRLILTGSGHPQLTLTNTSGSDHCGVNFGDSDDNNAGMIQYTNSSDYMVFHTGGTERIRIHNGLYTTFGTTSTYPRNGGIVEFFPEDNPFSFEVNSTKDLLDKFSLLQNSELVESQSNENFRHIEKALSKENYLNSFREIVKW